MALRLVCLLLLVVGPLTSFAEAQQDDVDAQASALEARLNQLSDRTPEGGAALLSLIELYHQNGRVLGLVRVGSRFVAAQPQHPRHADVMYMTFEGLTAASRTDELIAMGRQFTVRYPDHPKVADAESTLALIQDRLDRRADAAESYLAVWKKRGDSLEGRRALERGVRLFGELNNRESFTSAAELAEEGFRKVKDQAFAIECGWNAFYWYRRAEDWVRANALGQALLGKGGAISKDRQYRIHSEMGENYGRLQQRVNAIEHYQKAAALDPNSYAYYRLLSEMNGAQAKPEEMAPLVRDFLNKHNDSKYKPEILAWFAHAYLRNEKNDQARRLFQELLVDAPRTGEAARYFVRVSNDGQLDDAERQLRDALGKTKDQYAIRYALAFDLYRDRKQDEEKAKQMALELLTQSPADDWPVRDTLHWLLWKTEDEAAFRQVLGQVRQSMETRPWLLSYQSWLRDWGREAHNRKESRDRGALARDAFEALQKNAQVALWEQAKNDRSYGKKIEAREKLLEPRSFSQIPDAEAYSLASQQGYDLRHRSSQDNRPKSAAVFQQLAKRFPKDEQAAIWWLESASDYLPPEAAQEAVVHLLAIEPSANYHDSWRRLMQVAKGTGNVDLAKKTLAWIEASQKKHGPDIGSATSIGDRLWELELKDEATAYWTSHWKIDRNSGESRGSIDRLVERAEGDAKRKLLNEALAEPNDNHGSYALKLADLEREAGDWKAFSRWLTEARKRQDSRPFHEWGMDGGWLRYRADEIRRSESMSLEDKRLALSTIDEMGSGHASAVTSIALMELPESKPLEPMNRQLVLQRSTVTVGDGGGNFDVLRPFAQEFMAREDYASAATLLTGMLTNIRGLDDGRRDVARNGIARSYSRLGGVGLAIDDTSPIAPLLRASLYLRLGDRRMALETYQENTKLFDEYRTQVPVDLVLYVCESHIAAGGEDNLNRAEDILRSWLIANETSEDVEAPIKASIQLLLGRLYSKAQRYDVARSEFTTVLNRYAETPQAIEAQFGIGECFMSQKVYDQAEDIFTRLATHSDRDVVIRAEFLRGVLAYRRDDRDTAREIFRGVLEMVPSVELANQALFNLAEVYGAEQRYIDQLELLRTVGRLGRTSKRWHAPGQTLSIVVQDSDLGISRGHAKIPVQVRTQPGGDNETIYLLSGGAGKGLFRADVGTQLGAVTQGDGVLQLTGEDEILCDYPEEFKSEFRHVPLSDAQIRIGSVAELAAASRQIIDEKEETLSERLEREAREEREADRPASQRRPEDQIKPGNLIYLQVKDADRSTSDEEDEVFVKLTGTSGDSVQTRLIETGPHTGIFEAVAKTGELPAAALASDTSIEFSPLMAIDRDRATAWVSEPNGATPKWLSVDLKDLKTIHSVHVETPEAQRNAPVRFDVQASLDGVFWFPVAQVPERTPLAEWPTETGAMTQSVYRTRITDAEGWSKILEMVKNRQPISQDKAESLNWSLPADHEDAKQDFVVVWHGKLVQPREGAVRIRVNGQRSLVAIDGNLHMGTSGSGAQRECDVFLTQGAHDVTIVAATSQPVQGVSAQWARQDYSTAQPPLVPFRARDFDLEQPFAKPAPIRSAPKVVYDDADMGWEFKIDPLAVRHVRVFVHEYRGESVAFNHITIAGPDENGGEVVHIPTEADLLQLADNDVLEIAAGDSISVTYSDQFTQLGEENRLLASKLTATYDDADIEPIAYEFRRQSGNSFAKIRKRLMRIDPGERIIVEVTDYDRDTTEAPDTLTFTVQVNDGQPITFTATETEPSSGVFTREVDTASTAGEPAKNEPSAEAALGQAVDDEEAPAAATDGETLVVQPGDRVILSYSDEQNTFPGHTVPRETYVFVREPAPSRLRIVETRLSQPPEGSTQKPQPIYLGPQEDVEMARFTFEVPFTVEVYDPDAAKDDRSEVIVNLTTTDGATVPVRCVVSDAMRPDGGPVQPLQALLDGRFVGQVSLQLGGKNSADVVPLTQDMPRNLIGGPVLPEEQATGAGQALITRVLNLTGRDIVKAEYQDEMAPTPDVALASAEGRLISSGVLACLDRDYKNPLTQLHVGERLYLMITDPDLDTSDARDTAEVEITTPRGERELVPLQETLAHSGVFTGSVLLRPTEAPAAGNLDEKEPAIETYFGDTLSLVYRDAAAGTESGTLDVELTVPVVVGTDGLVAAFAKTFRDETIAVETQFHIAEAYFELFKSHRQLSRTDEELADLEAGRRVLREVMEDYPNPKYIPRVAYLLGQFAQELKQWDEAIGNYELIVRQYPEHQLAPDAQFKLAQCYEEASDFDQALEEYVTLAATYPNSPLIANVMIRISEYFWQREEFPVAAAVGEKFLERFEGHQWASRMAFRIGQCHYKDEAYKDAGAAFDRFAKIFPDDALASDSLFWAGESYRQARDYPAAFHRYNRCRYEHAESEAAKFARGRLQLPEMISEFERAARIDD